FRERIPRRALTKSELFTVAEEQADRLLDLHRITGPPVPTRILRAFSRVKIDYWRNIPVSGSTHWTGHDWMIILDANEPTVRQRFSLAHEVHHVVMHPVHQRVYSSAPQRPRRLEEVVANHFAANLLMPRAFVD